jgi:phosphate-selective porin OprO/OprP
LQARPELRDDDPAGAFGGVADSNRMIDTGFIVSGTEYLMGTELLYIRGPFSFQAEYGWNFINAATGVFNPGAVAAGNLKTFATPQNYVFNGGYVQLAYTLTGENRAYDKRIGTLAREYYGKSGPYSNAYIVRDEDGHIITSWGAWEIAARYSYTDLNDGSGATRIQGGEMDGFTLALNWTLNNNLNVMFDWVYDNRYNVPTAAPTYVSPVTTTTTNPGYTSGFGTRVQFQF